MVVWKQVFKALRERAFSNVAVYATLLCAGDAACQRLETIFSEEKAMQASLFGWYDSGRGFRFLAAGVPLGIVNHAWYSVLDYALPGRMTRTVLRKMASDQLIFAPIVVVLFFSICGAIEGTRPSDWYRELRQKALTVYAVDCMYWPPAQAVNFFFVPPSLRVVYVSVMTLIWNVFLSYAKVNSIRLPWISHD